MSQKIIICGATGATGSALAHKLAAQGQNLHLIGRDEAALTELANELDATYAVADVTDETAFTAALAAAGDDVTGFVYAIGSIVLKPLKQTDAKAFADTYYLNTIAPALALKTLQSQFTAGASAVLFSTVAVQHGFPNHSVISAAKGGVEGLVRALAVELAPKIRINAIAPSLTDSKMGAGMTQNSQLAPKLAAQHPMGRLGEPSDLANTAAWLLSSESSWITGQIIGVDGGRGISG